LERDISRDPPTPPVIPVSRSEDRDHDLSPLKASRSRAASHFPEPQHIGVPVFGCAKTGMTGVGSVMDHP